MVYKQMVRAADAQYCLLLKRKGIKLLEKAQRELYRCDKYRDDLLMGKVFRGMSQVK
jgi:hypothetical protein